MKTLAEPVLHRVLNDFGTMLTREVAQRIVDYRFDAKTQSRINKLARKCNEGELTESEYREYETYVFTIDFIANLQAKARGVLRQNAKTR